jgi:nucleoid DNA-binding protein
MNKRMPKNLSKEHLTRKVSAKTGIAQNEVKTIISVLTDEIIKSVEKSKLGEVKIEGLGTFKSVSSKRAGKIIINPKIKHTKRSAKVWAVSAPSAKVGHLKVGDPLKYSPLRYWLASPIRHNELKERDENTGQDNIERRKTIF